MPSVGSSPLTRGKPLIPRRKHPHPGLIPAHAGKTGLASRSRRGGWAHPRSREETPGGSLRAAARRAHPHSRGENTFIVTPWRQGEGSSPLTRGKRHPRRQRPRHRRLIPAHAGKTGTDPAAETPGRAHPHSHGENPTAYRGNAANAGSSPLTRGNQGRRDHQLPVLRLIPTDSGKTKSAQSQQSASWAHPHSRGEKLHLVTVDEAWAGSSPPTGEN